MFQANWVELMDDSVGCYISVLDSGSPFSHTFSKLLSSHFGHRRRCRCLYNPRLSSVSIVLRKGNCSTIWNSTTFSPFLLGIGDKQSSAYHGQDEGEQEGWRKSSSFFERLVRRWFEWHKVQRNGILITGGDGIFKNSISIPFIPFLCNLIFENVEMARLAFPSGAVGRRETEDEISYILFISFCSSFEGYAVINCHGHELNDAHRWSLCREKLFAFTIWNRQTEWKV